jgi:sialic acid synthase SpsE
MNDKVYIIAEAGVNHNGNIKTAKELIDIAVNSGANAVKFQTFKADKIVTKSAPRASYQIENAGGQESQNEMLKRLELSDANHKVLIDYCKEKKIEFLSTPFDVESLNLLTDTLHLKQIKISSGDLTNAPLLLEVARKQASIILSTGMSTLAEVEEALGVLAFGYLFSQETPTQPFKVLREGKF